MNDVFRLLHHLAFSNPQRGLGNGGRKVVDFNAVELLDAYHDGGQVPLQAHHNLARSRAPLRVNQTADDLVLQAAQGDIGFRQKVAAAASRVKEGQPCQLLLEGVELHRAGANHADFADFLQLLAQRVQEQRVNDLVDVLNGGVMHTAAAAGLRV